MDEVYEAQRDDREPDYKAAMLYHSDRADDYMAERDALRAECDRLREALERSELALDKAAKAMRGRCPGSDINQVIFEAMRVRAALHSQAPSDE